MKATMLSVLTALTLVLVPMGTAYAAEKETDHIADVGEMVHVPEEVWEISEDLGEKYCICPELLQAMAWKESRFRPDVENQGCIGIMQISERWHRDRMKRLGVNDLYDMRQNMTVAADYIAELAADGEPVEIALMKYHGESGISEVMDGTRESEYVTNILELAAELERQHGK